jgi:hypothetical protein
VLVTVISLVAPPAPPILRMMSVVLQLAFRSEDPSQQQDRVHDVVGVEVRSTGQSSSGVSVL